MMKKINILLLSLLFTLGTHTYLSIHHYSLKTGSGGTSLCSLNEKLNCDAAATSNFSEVFGIPIAVLGVVFHLILTLFVLFYKLGWSDASPSLRFTTRLMLGASAAVSVVMGLISLVLIKVACPFCVLGYLLSFLNLYLGWNLIEKTKESFDFSVYFRDYKSHLYSLAAIPLLSWAVSGMILKHYGLDQMERYIPEKIAIWKAGTEYSFDQNVGINNKVQNPKYILVEFADFKCPHCRTASKTIENFLRSRNDVLFVFKPYPLDGNCNSSITQKGDGTRCTLTSYALCAEKQAGKGLDVVHYLFEKQQELFSADPKSILPDLEKSFGLDTKALQECADSVETYNSIVQSTQEGDKANVEGTPTIYVNGRKLPWGQFLDVLKAAMAQ